MMSRYADDSARTISTKLKRSRVHPGADAPHDGLLDRIRNVIPLIAEKADEVESLCQPHDEVMEALQSTGVFKAFVPKAYGGYEIDLQEFIDIGLEVAQACCSTGWLTTFYMEHNWIVAAVLSDEAVDAIYSKQPYVLAPGSINPKGGEAAKVAGGYELSGRWHFSSGIVHGDWVILTAFLPGDPKGFPRTFLLPREDVRVEDTWDIAGMRGTGSHDAVVDGVFVPDLLTSPFPPPRRRSDNHEHFDMYRLPVSGFLPLTAAIPLVGAAKRALTVFRERLSTRVQMMSSTIQQEKASAQLRLGSVAMQILKAENTLRAAADRMQEITVRGYKPSARETTELQFMAADAVRDARNAVLSILEASGAHAHFEGSELQRIYRDILTGSGHAVFEIDGAAENYGRALIASDTS